MQMLNQLKTDQLLAEIRYQIVPNIKEKRQNKTDEILHYDTLNRYIFVFVFYVKINVCYW